ncbi:MAG: hypothetical protein V5A57_02240, partial [Candidatus Paceibacterota bacterium]
LTVLGTYLAAKELFLLTYSKNKADRIALFSSFFTAVSFWHINFSRIGFRAILVPLLLSFAFYFLFKGFRLKKWWSILISGLIFGLGIHTYVAYRLAVLAGAVMLLIWAYIYYREHNFKQFFKYFVLFVIGALITSAPLLMFFYNNPGSFMSRSSDVSAFGREQPGKAILTSMGKHLAMFNFVGDPNWRHNYSSSPTLFFPIGIFFLIGLFYSVKNTFSSFFNKNTKLFLLNKSLLSWWFVMLLPGILTIEGIPHALRCIGAITPTLIFAGLGLEKIYQNLKKYFNFKTLATLGVILALTLVGFQYFHYFHQWGRNPEVKRAFTRSYVDIANYLNELPDNVSKNVIIARKGETPADHSMGAQVVMFISATNNENINYLSQKEIDELTVTRPTVIVPLQNQVHLLNQLSNNFPKGEIKQLDNFKSFHINYE